MFGCHLVKKKKDLATASAAVYYCICCVVKDNMFWPRLLAVIISFLLRGTFRGRLYIMLNIKIIILNNFYASHFIKLPLCVPWNVKDMMMAHRYGQNMSCPILEVFTAVWLRACSFWDMMPHHSMMVPNILKEHNAFIFKCLQVWEKHYSQSSHVVLDCITYTV